MALRARTTLGYCLVSSQALTISSARPVITDAASHDLAEASLEGDARTAAETGDRSSPANVPGRGRVMA